MTTGLPPRPRRRPGTSAGLCAFESRDGRRPIRSRPAIVLRLRRARGGGMATESRCWLVDPGVEIPRGGLRHPRDHDRAGRARHGLRHRRWAEIATELKLAGAGAGRSASSTRPTTDGHQPRAAAQCPPHARDAGGDDARPRADRATSSRDRTRTSGARTRATARPRWRGPVVMPPPSRWSGCAPTCTSCSAHTRGSSSCSRPGVPRLRSAAFSPGVAFRSPFPHQGQRFFFFRVMTPSPLRRAGRPVIRISATSSAAIALAGDPARVGEDLFDGRPMVEARRAGSVEGDDRAARV